MTKRSTAFASLFALALALALALSAGTGLAGRQRRK